MTKLNKQERQLFDEVQLAMKYGENSKDGATHRAYYNGKCYEVHFCYSPKACNITVSLNGSKPNLFERAKNGVLSVVTPTKSWADVKKYTNGTDSDQVARFTGMPKHVLVLKSFHYAKHASK